MEPLHRNEHSSASTKTLGTPKPRGLQPLIHLLNLAEYHACVVQPRGFADAVAAHARQGIGTSLYPGLNFAKLSSFLQQPFSNHPTGSSRITHDHEPYEFACRWKFSTAGDRTVEKLQRPEQIAIESSKSGEKAHSILFLRGLPSSQWLSAIGGKHRVDPEFFQRHLDFWSTTGQLDYFPLPSLLSTSENLIELCYVSVGQMENPGLRFTMEDIAASRHASEKAMGRYNHNLNSSLDSGCALGTSIVRNFDFQDETHFAIEQRISICLTKGGDSHTSKPHIRARNILAKNHPAIIWIDTGKPLNQGPDGPWRDYHDKHNINHTVFHPTIQILPQIALKAHRMSLDNLPQNEAIFSPGNDLFSQSAALLTCDYGKTLDSKHSAIDPFYALHELFLFSAFSLAQYFNMLESKMTADTKAQASSQQVADISNFLYRQSIFEKHAVRLRQIIATIEARSSLHRSQASNTSTDSVPRQAARALLVDYQQLLARSENLSNQCQAQVSLLMNRAMITESNKAIQQAQEVTKLTRLAFIFIPLGFTSSFCGMNLWPFVATGGSVWWWFVMSAPLIIVSFVVLRWDVVRLWQGICTGLKQTNR
ncbi:MAG: hypothetical protein Q9170_004507 [Blastenia crenularia]